MSAEVLSSGSKVSNTAPLGIINIIKGLYKDLSKSEKKVAKYLISNPTLFVNASVKEVATVVGVSEPTIVRFGRNIGCDGFKDLKMVLAQFLAVEQALFDSENTTSINRHNSETFIDEICSAAVTTLTQTAQSIDNASLARAAQSIADGKRVFIYGIGGSSAILAKEIHNRLFRLNIASTPYTDSYQQRMSSSTLTPDDVALFISSTGRPRSLIDCAELAKYYGATAIAIAPKKSSLAQMMDVCLDINLSQSGVAPGQPNPMRFAQLLLIDSLALQTAYLLGGSAQQSLNRVRACVASMHGIVPQQPIGD
ncbi:MurR/RpiR family transcriptional regulator [Paremcibacter congregatus]|uniref:MurR/RpiR family transcriptional regulator n=1 Tax=Paremcibacter congregatus TaxID=2043170 RepID=UPI003A94E84B